VTTASVLTRILYVNDLGRLQAILAALAVQGVHPPRFLNNWRGNTAYSASSPWLRNDFKRMLAIHPVSMKMPVESENMTDGQLLARCH